MPVINIRPDYDGFVQGQSTDYATARGTATIRGMDGSNNIIGQGLNAVGNYNVFRSVARYDTSVLPLSATINNATLRMACYDVNIPSSDNFDIQILQYDWGDYYPIVESTAIDATFDGILASTAVDTVFRNTSGMTTDTNYYSTDLDTSWIKLNDYTYYAFRSSRDYNNTTPTTNEDVKFFTDETTSFIGPTTDREFAYPLLSIDYSAPDAVSYNLQFKWDSTDYNIYNEAGRMKKFTVDRGRREVFGKTFNDYDIGELRVELENFDRRYDPWNPSSPLYGNIHPGVEVRFRATYDDWTSTFFTGQLADIEINGYGGTATLICKDPWKNLRDNDIDYAPQTSSDFAALFSGVLETTNYNYPYELKCSTSTKIPSYFWLDGTLKEFIEEVAFGSLGQAWIDVDGDFNFRAIDDSNTFLEAIGSTSILKDIYIAMPWDNYKSKIELNGYKLARGESSTDEYWFDYEDWEEIDGATTTDAGGAYSRWIHFAEWYPDPPVCTTNENIEYFFDGEVSTGRYAVEWSEVGSASAKLTIYNESTSAFTYTGTKYSKVEPPLEYYQNRWEFESTDSSMPDNLFSLDSNWLSMAPTTEEGSSDDYDYIQDTGNTLIDYLSVVRPYPIIQLQGRYATQFRRDLEDHIELDLSIYPLLSTSYSISAITHESLSGPQDVLTTFYLYPLITKST